MVEGGIMRNQTSEELSDYRLVGDKTAKQIFLKQVAVVEADFTKRHEAYDGPCVRLDFADKVDDIEKESERLHGYVRQEDVKSLKFDDLDKYGDKTRFEIVDDSVDMDTIIVNGRRQTQEVGHTVTYVCKRGHKISVFVPSEVYEERFKKEEVKEEVVKTKKKEDK